MSKQQYSNHVRYYIPHHFFFYGIILLMSAGAFGMGFAWDLKNHFLWVFLGLVVLLVGWLSYMLRQHYALTLQNRIVITELRYRYLALTGERLEQYESQLSEGQLYALRFAPDEELPELLKKAIAENLSADAIKKSVKNWKADDRRV
jgi:hypothetical protein